MFPASRGWVVLDLFFCGATCGDSPALGAILQTWRRMETLSQRVGVKELSDETILITLKASYVLRC